MSNLSLMFLAYGILLFGLLVGGTIITIDIQPTVLELIPPSEHHVLISWIVSSFITTVSLFVLATGLAFIIIGNTLTS